MIGIRPLPCIIVISKSKLTSFSLSGDILAEEESEGLVNGMIVRDSEFKEYIAYSKREQLLVRKLPYLEEHVVANVGGEITSFAVKENQRVVLALEDGKIISVSSN